MSGYISFSLFDSTQLFKTPSICMLHDHIQTHYNGYNSSERVIIPS